MPVADKPTRTFQAGKRRKGTRRSEDRAWNLYWVATPASLEDCFVVAKDSAQAAAHESGSTGFDVGSCVAEHVADIPESFVEIAEKIHDQ